MKLVDTFSLAKIAKRMLAPPRFNPPETAVAPLQPVPLRSPDPPPNATNLTLEPARTPKAFRELLAERWYGIGLETARTTKVLKPDPLILKTLEERAGAFAPADISPEFDPNRYQIDQRKQSTLDDLDVRREEAETGCEIAAGQLRQREEELAKTPKPGPWPIASACLRWAAVAAINISLMSTIHDLLTGMFPLLRWIVAIGFSGAFSVFIVTAILPDDEVESEGDAPMSNAATLAGICIGIAFFIARLSLAQGSRDWLLAAGSAGMEIATVFFLDVRAKAISSARAVWRMAERKHTQAEELVRAARSELERRKDALQEIERGIEQIETEDLKDRVWGNNPETIKALAVAAVRSGYLSGIAENRALTIVPKEAA